MNSELQAQVNYILGATDVRPIESTDTHRPTPWGKADYQYKVQRGIALVNTPGHGGFLIGQGIAQSYLSPEAIKAGEPFGSYLAYEEDVDAAIVLFEHPELIEQLGFRNTTREDLAQTLFTYRKDYLEARGQRCAAETAELTNKI
jgi:uncharacterized protein DUF7007